MSENNSIEVELEVISNATTEIAEAMDEYTAEQARVYKEEAEAAAEAAKEAQNMAEAWAESDVAPAGEGTRSSKTWSDVSRQWAESDTEPDGVEGARSSKTWSDVARQWAESDTEPDGVEGAKSSKTWAEESAASAAAAEKSAEEAAASAVTATEQADRSTEAADSAEKFLEQMEIDLSSKADIDSPTFTGTPKAPTPGSNADSTQIATVGYVAEYGGSGGDLSDEYRRVRYAYVGQSSSTTTLPWYRFASISISDTNSDRDICFKVNAGYSTNYNKCGILTAHIRLGSTVDTFGNAQLYWEQADTGITLSNFVLAYKLGSSTTEVELWVKIDSAWLFYFFEVLYEGNRTRHLNSDYWTLYNHSSEGYADSITSGYTQVTSTLATHQNPASKVGTSTVGGTSKPVYINSGTPTAISDTVGSGTQPVYLNGGTITKIGTTVGGTAKPIYSNAGVLTAISSTVGSGTVPIYSSSGTLTASSSTVGSGTKPVYLNSGTITACGTTVGSGTVPIYSSSGTLTASSSTVGSATKPIYLNSGTLTASGSTVGSATKPVYLSSGTITASGSTVGGTATPVYLNAGTITKCSYSFSSSNCNCMGNDSDG